MRVCVFCGSSTGSRTVFEKIAAETGRTIAALHHEIVYGGGKVGLMGALADSALSCSGRVTGVMPKHLIEREIVHLGLTELIEVRDMHDRKLEMSSRSDAFLTLPGGAGTLEEMFEQWTWAQLGLHAKPCGLLNVEGYFDPLIVMIDKMVEEGFLKIEYRNMLIIESEVSQVLFRFKNYAPPSTKWVTSNLGVIA